MAAKQLREGVTTGTCATAAAMASALWQTDGKCPEAVAVDTPSGKTVRLEICQLTYPDCAVIKDAGDDPDVTNGCSVCASVEIAENAGDMTFVGGDGVGTVTLPGLKLPVGEPAINPVPRQMIEEHVRKVIADKGAKVTIWVPEGAEITKKTFNPRLGIVGGISILGTTGIVRPMSEDALKESLSVELGVRLAASKQIVLVPGASGEDALQQHFGQAMNCAQMSNYVGYMLDEALRMGAERILIAGFAGKMVKLAADIMNTHSHVADGRRETICTYAALNGASIEIIRALFESKTARHTTELLKQYHMSWLWSQIAEAGSEKCRLRVLGQIPVEMIIFDEHKEILGVSQHVEEMLQAMGIEYQDFDRVRNKDR